MNLELDDTSTPTSEQENEDSKPESQADKTMSNATSTNRDNNGNTNNNNNNKKRTWKKPKDKPKRSLTSYNIFFQYERARILSGRDDDANPEDVMREVEAILSNKTKAKRRHRKSHGRIGFQDLARTIASKWKTVDPKIKAIFVYYADVDTHRYRKEVKLWKEKKEKEEGYVSSEEYDHGIRPLFTSSTPRASTTEQSFSNMFSEFPDKVPEDDSVKPGFDSEASLYERFNSSSSSLEDADIEYPVRLSSSQFDVQPTVPCQHQTQQTVDQLQQQHMHLQEELQHLKQHLHQLTHASNPYVSNNRPPATVCHQQQPRQFTQQDQLQHKHQQLQTELHQLQNQLTELTQVSNNTPALYGSSCGNETPNVVGGSLRKTVYTAHQRHFYYGNGMTSV